MALLVNQDIVIGAIKEMLPKLKHNRQSENLGG